jgi:hypothetical protein
VDVGSTRLLAAVIRMQCEIETLKESAAMFNEPYLSETSRSIDACNNPVLGPIIQAGWHLQAAQCALEANTTSD